MDRPLNMASERQGLKEYGRSEVKQSLHKNMVRGLTVSIAIHIGIIGGYYAALYINEDDDNAPTVGVRMLKYSDLGPPPSISSAPLAPPVGVSAVAKPTVGVPVPVPDAEVSPEQTIATQTELSNAPSPITEQLGNTGDIQISPDLSIDGDVDPNMEEFIPVEKPPQIIKRVLPVYPEMALRAGLEGKVWVKVLVDKEGKPRKAIVIKSTTEIFNDVAVDAAMQFLFTPAVMNGGPVKVWLSIPFKFTIANGAS